MASRAVRPVDRSGDRITARRVAARLREAAAAGLMSGPKSKRLSGRVHPQLLAAAAANSGLDGNDLLEFALATVALEDDFAERLLAREGSVPRDIDLEFRG